jgi:hypothetical protein
MAYKSLRLDTHSGLPATSFTPTHIDSNGEFLWWPIERQGRAGRELKAYIQERSPEMEAIGCDGCTRRHNARRLFCSANFKRGAPKWLDSPEIKPVERDLIYLYSLTARRERMEGVWKILWETVDMDGRHTSGKATLLRVDYAGLLITAAGPVDEGVLQRQQDVFWPGQKRVGEESESDDAENPDEQ